MRIGLKILLLMLLITVGSLAVVSWIITLTVTNYETTRADDQITLAIGRYGRELDEHCRQINHLVQAMLGDPTLRSLLEAADDAGDASAREQLKEEVFGHDVQRELASVDEAPVFHVLINLSHEVLLVSVPSEATTQPNRPSELEQLLTKQAVNWPIDLVLTGGSKPVMQYVATPEGLFLAMGVPLREELSEPPTQAYFVGFKIDDAWVSQQLVSLQPSITSESTVAPLAAWFIVDDKIVARACSDASDMSYQSFSAETPLRPAGNNNPTTVPAAVDRVEFNLAGNEFIGQAFNLDPGNPRAGRLVLASSLDRALIPLHRLQRSILISAVGACVIALIICRGIASMISKPIEELVKGTRRIASGQFDSPVQVRRHDELGALADSFNSMAQGLKERDVLILERSKMERDLAVARKIQMDVLPKNLPACPGYDMAAFSLPAEQTGGDIYDVVAMALDPTSEGDASCLVLLLADASGHGIGPALSVTQVRSMLRIGVRLRAQLDDVFSQINRQLCQDLGSERFVTAFLGLLDPASHSIRYESAGQGPILHFHAATRRFQWLDSSMPPLGILEQPINTGSSRLQLEPGDVMILLTDGFYEYQDNSDNFFGKERVAEIVLRYHDRPARELLNELLAATQQFAHGAPQLDDMTGLVIRRL